MIKHLKYDALVVWAENADSDRAIRDFIKKTRCSYIFRQLKDRNQNPKKGERKRLKRARASKRRQKDGHNAGTVKLSVYNYAKRQGK